MKIIDFNSGDDYLRECNLRMYESFGN